MKGKKILALMLSLILVLSAFSVPAYALNLSTYDRTVLAGESGTAKDFTGLDPAEGLNITYTSSNPSVLRVESDGRWKAVGTGTANFVQHNNQMLTNTFRVTVVSFLKKSNFNFNRKLDGYSNYVDHVEGYTENHETLRAIVQTKRGTQGDYEVNWSAYLYVIPTGWKTLDNIKLDQNGVTFGDTKQKVFEEFGSAARTISGLGVLQTSIGSDDKYISKQNPYDKAVEKVTYGLYQDNHFFCQRFYFNEQGRVCMIVWFVSD